jgi:hypothetical protein
MPESKKQKQFNIFLAKKYGKESISQNSQALSLEEVVLNTKETADPDYDIEDKLFDEWQDEFRAKHKEVLLRLKDRTRGLDELLVDIEKMPPKGKKYPLLRLKRDIESALERIELDLGQTARLSASALLISLFIVGAAPSKTGKTVAHINNQIFNRGVAADHFTENRQLPEVPQERLASYVRQFHNTRNFLGEYDSGYTGTVPVDLDDLTGQVAGAQERSDGQPSGEQNDNFIKYIYRLLFRP